MNAKQLQMTGIVVSVEDMHVVVVEGGPKQQRYYKKLMLNRINWGEEVVGQKKAAKEDDQGQRNECVLVSILMKKMLIDLKFRFGKELFRSASSIRRQKFRLHQIIVLLVKSSINTIALSTGITVSRIQFCYLPQRNNLVHVYLLNRSLGCYIHH
jgi:hypothetical protein